ncbi:MAG: YhcN/YlaJ family sporulation lipoprotein [Peptococcaceae bacterium]
MQRNKTVTMFLIVIILIGLVLSTACTPQQKPAPAPRDNNNNGMGDTRMEERNNQNKTANNDEAARLAETITSKVEKINSATVVFADKVAYIGIDLYANLSGNEAETVKNQVAQIVKQENADIDTVYVTEDADTYTRLQKIANDIENGQPLSGFLTELENMFKRITPSMD